MNESTIGTHVSFIFRGYFTHILGCKTFIKGKNYVFFFFFAILHLLNSLRTFFGELAGVSHPQHLAICFFWGGTLKFSPE